MFKNIKKLFSGKKRQKLQEEDGSKSKSVHNLVEDSSLAAGHSEEEVQAEARLSMSHDSIFTSASNLTSHTTQSMDHLPSTSGNIKDKLNIMLAKPPQPGVMMRPKPASQKPDRPVSEDESPGPDVEQWYGAKDFFNDKWAENISKKRATVAMGQADSKQRKESLDLDSVVRGPGELNMAAARHKIHLRPQNKRQSAMVARRRTAKKFGAQAVAEEELSHSEDEILASAGSSDSLSGLPSSRTDSPISPLARTNSPSQPSPTVDSPKSPKGLTNSPRQSPIPPKKPVVTGASQKTTQAIVIPRPRIGSSGAGAAASSPSTGSPKMGASPKLPRTGNKTPDSDAKNTKVSSSVEKSAEKSDRVSPKPGHLSPKLYRGNLKPVAKRSVDEPSNSDVSTAEKPSPASKEPPGKVPPSTKEPAGKPAVEMKEDVAVVKPAPPVTLPDKRRFSGAYDNVVFTTAPDSTETTSVLTATVETGSVVKRPTQLPSGLSSNPPDNTPEFAKLALKKTPSGSENSGVAASMEGKEKKKDVVIMRKKGQNTEDITKRQTVADPLSEEKSPNSPSSKEERRSSFSEDTSKQSEFERMFRNIQQRGSVKKLGSDRKQPDVAKDEKPTESAALTKPAATQAMTKPVASPAVAKPTTTQAITKPATMSQAETTTSSKTTALITSNSKVTASVPRTTSPAIKPLGTKPVTIQPATSNAASAISQPEEKTVKPVTSMAQPEKSAALKYSSSVKPGGVMPPIKKEPLFRQKSAGGTTKEQENNTETKPEEKVTVPKPGPGPTILLKKTSQTEKPSEVKTTSSGSTTKFGQSIPATTKQTVVIPKSSTTSASSTPTNTSNTTSTTKTSTLTSTTSLKITTNSSSSSTKPPGNAEPQRAQTEVIRRDKNQSNKPSWIDEAKRKTKNWSEEAKLPSPQEKPETEKAGEENVAGSNPNIDELRKRFQIPSH